MFSLRSSLPRLSSATRFFSTTSARPLAKMQLIGRLATTPELTPTSTGKEVIRYNLGVNTGAKDEQGNRGVSWFKVASFQPEGPSRDLLLSLPKGTKIYVEAEARMDTYQAQDGTNRSSLSLIQRSFETLARPRNQSETASESS